MSVAVQHILEHKELCTAESAVRTSFDNGKCMRLDSLIQQKFCVCVCEAQHIGSNKNFILFVLKEIGLSYFVYR